MNKLLSTYCELIGRLLATKSSGRLNLCVCAHSHPLVVVSALARSSQSGRLRAEQTRLGCQNHRWGGVRIGAGQCGSNIHGTDQTTPKFLLTVFKIRRGKRRGFCTARRLDDGNRERFSRVQALDISSPTRKHFESLRPCHASPQYHVELSQPCPDPRVCATPAPVNLSLCVTNDTKGQLRDNHHKPRHKSKQQSGSKNKRKENVAGVSRKST